MSPVRVSGALLERLGEPASAALNEMLDAQQRASTEAAMTQCGDRFERRLIEETSKLRLETTQLRGEMREGFADLRRDMADLRAGISSDRFDLLKWAFAFWVGQLAAIAGIVFALLRTLPPR
jgi:hypothetical protein